MTDSDQRNGHEPSAAFESVPLTSDLSTTISELDGDSHSQLATTRIREDDALGGVSAPISANTKTQKVERTGNVEEADESTHRPAREHIGRPVLVGGQALRRGENVTHLRLAEAGESWARLNGLLPDDVVTTYDIPKDVAALVERLTAKGA